MWVPSSEFVFFSKMKAAIKELAKGPDVLDTPCILKDERVGIQRRKYAHW